MEDPGNLKESGESEEFDEKKIKQLIKEDNEENNLRLGVNGYENNEEDDENNDEEDDESNIYDNFDNLNELLDNQLNDSKVSLTLTKDGTNSDEEASFISDVSGEVLLRQELKKIGLDKLGFGTPEDLRKLPELLENSKAQNFDITNMDCVEKFLNRKLKKGYSLNIISSSKMNDDLYIYNGTNKKNTVKFFVGSQKGFYQYWSDNKKNIVEGFRNLNDTEARKMFYGEVQIAFVIKLKNAEEMSDQLITELLSLYDTNYAERIFDFLFEDVQNKKRNQRFTGFFVNDLDTKLFKLVDDENHKIFCLQTDI
jgi:hypothetical protein